jgi:hypothetical protein
LRLLVNKKYSHRLRFRRHKNPKFLLTASYADFKLALDQICIRSPATVAAAVDFGISFCLLYIYILPFGCIADANLSRQDFVSAKFAPIPKIRRGGRAGACKLPLRKREICAEKIARRLNLRKSFGEISARF